ncbi:hypothetical protein AURDEDRAFT_159415 [Auricularia subglabra TFB-10046 SS5]|nr:hypothetical protein AURDEDRAFT_159415 [Auricularia subglabra TFB-10046 SS5]
MSANASNVSSNAFAILHVEQYGSDDEHDAQNHMANETKDVEMTDATQLAAGDHPVEDASPEKSTEEPAADLGGAKKSKARLASDAALDTSPKKVSKKNDGARVPVKDPVETEDTTSEEAVRIAVADAIKYHDDGVADGREGTYLARFPPKGSGHDARHQYYKGFARGAHAALKGKARTRTASPALWGVDPGDEDAARDTNAGLNLGTDGFRGESAHGREHSAERADFLVPAILPPSAQPPKRGAKHLNPDTGPLVVHALRNIARPEATDRRSITRKWHPRQRNALFDYKKPGAFVVSEQSGSTPASPEATVAIIRGIWRKAYPGQRPPTIILPIPANPGEAPPPGAFVSGTEEQIDHFVDVCTWSTSIGCVFGFPNEDLESDFACTFRAPSLEHEQADTVREVVVDTLDKSDVVKEFVEELDGDLEAIKDGTFVEFIRIKEGRFDVNLFNLYIPPPSRLEKHALRWREIIAGLTPGDDLVGEIVSHKKPFKCGTCGCLCHPQGMCGTISEPKWLGFLPMPHNPPEALEAAAPTGRKVAVAGGSHADSAPKASTSGGKKADKSSDAPTGQGNKKGGKAAGKK